jgi:hypothetical protein
LRKELLSDTATPSGLSTDPGYRDGRSSTDRSNRFEFFRRTPQRVLSKTGSGFIARDRIRGDRAFYERDDATT